LERGNIFTFLVTGIVLSGCAGQGWNDSQEIVDFGWASHPKEQYIPQPLYCYKTLGRTDCYKEPQPELEDRLVNYYSPNDAQQAHVDHVVSVQDKKKNKKDREPVMLH